MMFDRFCRLVEKAPETKLYSYLKEGGTPGDAETWTTAETRDQIQSLAAYLRAQVEPGARVLILMPPGLMFIRAFFACILAGVIAVPAAPANFERNTGARQRIKSIAASAGIKLVLHDSAGNTAQKTSLADVLPRGVPWLATDTVAANYGTVPFEADPNDVALLQFTSGSTGSPKGVEVSVRNIVHNARVIEKAMAFNQQSRLVSWLPFFHDMGLFSGVIQPMLVGFPAFLMPPATFIKSPVTWLNAVTTFKATVSGAPNFAYDLCASKISDAEKAGLDLNRWQVAFNGAEPIRAATLDRFTAAFASCGFHQEKFYTCYGLAEATLMVTGSTVGEPVARNRFDRTALGQGKAAAATGGTLDKNSLELIASGHIHPDRSATGNRCAIVDPETLLLCQSNDVGEIVVSGDSITRGYWNNPEATSETIVTLALPNDPGPKPYLRTGDLGFVRDGHLYVTGRRKDVIILNGRNIYPQDIEETFEAETCLDESGSCVVFTLDDPAQTSVLVQQVTRQIWRDINSKADQGLIEQIQNRVEAARAAINACHGFWIDRICLIKTMSLPKTTSGKVQRAATRTLYEAGHLAIGIEITGLCNSNSQGASPVESNCPITRKVHDIWCAELDCTDFPPGTDFFALGGNSLQAARILARINECFDAQMELLDFIDQPTVGAIAKHIKTQSAKIG